ncbi:immune inhibitor A [Candidatus Woesearchaeota archaeon]|nr:immune inhibitor A [Candidatus Woesearchaeota archaeon]
MRHTIKQMDHRLFGGIALALLLLFAGASCVAAIGLGTFEKEVRYTPGQLSSIKYFLVNGANEDLSVALAVDGTLAPYAAFRLDNYWYSTRLDKSDVYLQREFNLTGVSSATLKFNTKYSVEYGWDFGYVEVSTDNGSTWSQLAGTTTTAYRDPGAYIGVPGAPAYTGSVSDWTPETMDLTHYAGDVILLRFWYVSDDYYAEHGWLVDDISIPEIGFFDDVQSSTTGWSTNGWLRNVIELGSSTKMKEIYLDFVIPPDYTYNNTVEKITVTEIAGVDSDYNPSQGSVARIIVMLPGLVKVVPPSPPGGGGGGGLPYFARTIDNVVTFIISSFEPHKEYVLRPTMAESIVKGIRLMLNSFVDGAEVRITPLSERPVSIRKDLPDVYWYFEVSTSNLYDLSVDRAVIEVAVSKEWMDLKNASPGDIVVTRYHDGVWSDLDTKLAGEDRESFFYEAESPGFSVFAVRVRSPIEPENVTEPVPTRKPDITHFRKVTVIVGDETAADMEEQLRRKTDASAEEMEKALGPVAERPAQPGWLKVLVVVLVLLAVLASIAMLASRYRRYHPEELRTVETLPEKPAEHEVPVKSMKKVKRVKKTGNVKKVRKVERAKRVRKVKKIKGIKR